MLLKVLVLCLLALAAALVVIGVALISPPAGWIAAGIGLATLTIVAFADGRR